MKQRQGCVSIWKYSGKAQTGKLKCPVVCRHYVIQKHMCISLHEQLQFTLISKQHVSKILNSPKNYYIWEIQFNYVTWILKISTYVFIFLNVVSSITVHRQADRVRIIIALQSKHLNIALCYTYIIPVNHIFLKNGHYNCYCYGTIRQDTVLLLLLWEFKKSFKKLIKKLSNRLEKRK